MNPTMKAVYATLPQTGEVTWIGLRADKKQLPTSVQEVEVDEVSGLAGDHYGKKRGKRQVTLIQEEHLAAVSAFLGKPITPAAVRRNIVVRGINLLALKDRQFRLGDEVILEMTGLCHPCTKMETNLGPGGFNAMRGHGGITARVIRGGRLRLGDVVRIALVHEAVTV